MKPTIRLQTVALFVILLGWNCATVLAITPKLIGTITTTTGQAITAGSLLEVLDSNGVLQMLTIPKAGTYSISTSGLMPPLLLEASDQSNSLFGYSETGTGIANIDPMSDLIVNQPFQAFNTTPALQFAGAPTPPMTLTPAQIASATALMNFSLQQPLNNFKVKSGFDFLTTKFTLSSAFGKFLTHSTFGGFGTTSNTLESIFGGVNYNATFWARQSPAGTWVSWTADTSTPTPATSQSSYYAYYPDESDAQKAYDGVGTFFSTYLATLKHEGKLLDAINLLPLYTPSGFLNDGKTVDIETGFQATFLRTVKVSAFTRGAITSFQANTPDSNNNVIGLDYYIAKTDQGLKVTDLKSAYFVCNKSSLQCLLYGNQLNARVDLKTAWELDSFSAAPATPFGTLKVRASALTGTVDSIDISDMAATFFSGAALTSNGQKTDQYQPFHNGPMVDYVTDAWSLSHAALPPAIVYSDPFSIDLNLLPSGTQSFTKYTFGASTETVNLIKPALAGGHTLGDFNIGKSLKVQWSLPVTYIVDNIRLSGKVCGATMNQSVDGKPIKTTATSATITLPKLAVTEPVTDASFKLSFDGPRGERSMVVYGSNAACQ